MNAIAGRQAPRTVMDRRGRYGEVLNPQQLTKRQREIAALVVSGLSNRQIAERLGVHSQTLKNHLLCIYDKLDVRSLGGRRNVAVMRALGDHSDTTGME